jgi:RHS repeat-associated protein
LAPGSAIISRQAYTYDPVSNISSWTQQTGVSSAQVQELGYDRSDQLTSAVVKTTAVPQTTLKRRSFGYDPTGNRTSNQTDNQVQSGTYNARNQLLSTQAGGALVFRGSVNEPAKVTIQSQAADVTVDNRFSGAASTTGGTNTVTVTATDFSQPANARTNTYEVGVSGATTSYAYDANGNLTGDGTRIFEWDAENRLTAVRQGAVTLASFTYDGYGRRASKSAAGVTRLYVYDGDNITIERLVGGGRIRYVHGPGVDQPLAAHDDTGVLAYHVADHLGSILHVTNATGAVTLSREYDAWGNLLQASGVSGYAFTGREWDAETGLYYYRARYYDPKIGRFISEDPIRFQGGVNFYAYVANRPTVNVDPFGLVKWDCRVTFLSFTRFGASASNLNAQCTSECACGIRVTQTIVGGGGGLSVGPTRVGGVGFRTVLWDPFPCPTQNTLPGVWVYKSAGVVPGGGVAMSFVQLGWAATPDPGPADPTGNFINMGWDAGVDFHSGASAAPSTKQEKCCN